VMGAGQGMAAHGLGSGGIAAMGAQMAVGVGMGNVMAQGFVPRRRSRWPRRRRSRPEARR